MNLTTKTRVKRLQWKVMVTTELIIDVMNHFDDKNQVDIPQEAQQPPVQEPVQVPAEAQAKAPTEVQSTEQDEAVAEDVPDLVDPGPDSDPEDEDEGNKLQEEERT